MGRGASGPDWHLRPIVRRARPGDGPLAFLMPTPAAGARSSRVRGLPGPEAASPAPPTGRRPSLLAPLRAGPDGGRQGPPGPRERRPVIARRLRAGTRSAAAPTTRRRGRGHASAGPGDADSPRGDSGVEVCAGSFTPRGTMMTPQPGPLPLWPPRVRRAAGAGPGLGRPQPSRKPSDGCPLPPRAAFPFPPAPRNCPTPLCSQNGPQCVGTAPSGHLHFRLLCLSPAQQRVPSNLSSKQHEPSPHTRHSTAFPKLMLLTCRCPSLLSTLFLTQFGP